MPRFSYAISHSERGETQSAYRIIVSANNPALSKKILRTQGVKTVWDSGKVISNKTTNIPYTGSALEPDTDYSFSVTWMDSKGAASAPANSTFSTGYTFEGYATPSPPAFISAAPQKISAESMLRAEFHVTGSPTRARLYIIGLGYYKSYINGELTDNHELGPFTTFEKRILYDTWDVTHLVTEGCNTLGVMLGTGWYAQHTIKSGPKSLSAVLSITTDDGKKHVFQTATAGDPSNSLVFTTAPSPVVSDDIYVGEVYDARLEQQGWNSCGFTPSTPWSPAVKADHNPISAGAAVNARTVQITVDRTYSVVNITEPLGSGNGYVVDFGQNIAGLLRINVVCPEAGTSIHMHFGESLHEDGTVLNQYGGIMNANYTCKGTGDIETYQTLFAYYGFRFVQVTNFPGVPNEGSFLALFIHSDVPQTGSLTTDNHAINAIQHATRFASLSNLMDIPTDCPQRERRGWLGDAQLSCETTIHNFDMAAFYTKWMRDIRDSQSFYNSTHHGSIPDCVPYYGHGALPADPAWSAAYPLITNWVSEYYADDRIITEHYDGIKSFMDSQITQLDPNGLLSFAHYGDWCSVSDGASTGAGFKRPSISTFYFIKGLQVLTSFAQRLGKTADARKYGDLEAKTSATFQTLLYNNSTHMYEDGYPISQIMAFTLGVVPKSDSDAVLNNLLDMLAKGTHSGLPNAPTGGIVFTKYFWDLMQAKGHNDLGIQYMLAKGMPSFSYWIEPTNGGVPATTLWENWQSTAFNPHGSYNHIMYGGFGRWLYGGLAGVTRMPGSRGWDNVLFAPAMHHSKEVTSASASIDTPQGLVSVDWDSNYKVGGSCGTDIENPSRPTYLKLSCASGKFTGVAFASFGTPSGSCDNGFTKGKCDSPNSVAKVAAACVGKSECNIQASNEFFGGDPCPLTPKKLSVVMKGCDAPTAALGRVSITVPTGSTGTLLLPLPNGTTPAQVVVHEGEAVIWRNGAFVSGVPGVTNAMNVGVGIEIATGSGTYTFT